MYTSAELRPLWCGKQIRKHDKYVWGYEDENGQASLVIVHDKPSIPIEAHIDSENVSGQAIPTS